MQVIQLIVNVVLAMAYGLFLHELGHVLMAEFLGLKVKRLTFRWPLGCGFIRTPGTAGQNCAVALAGPAMNLLLAAAFWDVPSIAWGNMTFALINLTLPHSDGWKAMEYLRRGAKEQGAERGNFC
jgi:Zn-dependent protease